MKGKTYAVSDLHGYLDLYKQIKEYIKPEDVVYFLGDATDRGPNSWELAKTIYDDPQFIYLKGNHEDMLIKAVIGHINSAGGGFPEYNSLMGNGGKQTWKDVFKDPEGIDYIRKLVQLPEEAYYINDEGRVIHLSHAGFTPNSPYGKDLLWDRDHIFDDGSDIPEDWVIVHGHTPVYFQREQITTDEIMETLFPELYANCKKLNIDMGTYITKTCCLVDLDTFECKMFQSL